MAEQHWSIGDAQAVAREGGARAVVAELLHRRSLGAAMPEAWIHQVGEPELVARAEEVDARLARGDDLPLAGVPFAVKDNIDVAGVPTTAGCQEYSYVPTETAASVALLLDAGAVFAGKTNLDQFATGLVGTRSPQFGPCCNPFDPSFIAGGSSSGSAIAVATGQVPLALGTDTAGSGRVPAALCGVVGLKPAPRVIPIAGVVAAMASYDAVSVFTSTVADAGVLDVLMGGSLPAGRMPTRIGILDAIDWCGDGDASACFDAVIARVAAAGGTISTVDGERLRELGELLYGSALVAERHAAFGEFAEAHPSAMDPAVLEIVRAAGTYSGSDAFRALAALRARRTAIDHMWTALDALVVPTVARVPTFDEAMTDPLVSVELGRLTAFVNLLDLACVSIPAGTRVSGIPFGVSLLAPRGRDADLQLLAAALTGAKLSPNRHTAGPFRLAVVGAHLSGQPLNHQLTDLGATLLTRTTTAPEYSLFALATVPPKPGLVRDPGSGGAIEVEVWGLDTAGFAAFVGGIPSPLGIGKVALADGSEVPGFLCEPHAVAGAPDITAFGGWRAYLASQRVLE